MLAATLTSALLVSTLAACGGDEPSASDKPAETSSSPTSSAPSPSETPTPTPSPTLRPLSRFEDEPTVKVARKWAAAVARSATKGDASLRAIKPYVTPTGLKKMQGYFEEDLGLKFPGPVPFTPVGVRGSGGSAQVPMCMWTQGFGFDKATNKPRDARRIDAGKFLMVKSGGVWKINDMVYAQHSCDKTAVKGRAF